VPAIKGAPVSYVHFRRSGQAQNTQLERKKSQTPRWNDKFADPGCIFLTACDGLWGFYCDVERVLSEKQQQQRVSERGPMPNLFYLPAKCFLHHFLARGLLQAKRWCVDEE
jgi:hypothetical protein